MVTLSQDFACLQIKVANVCADHDAHHIGTSFDLSIEFFQTVGGSDAFAMRFKKLAGPMR